MSFTDQKPTSKETEVEFHDPHPGLKGCPKQLPEYLRITAQWLNGQIMTLEEAIQCFKDAAPEHERPISVETYENTIIVRMGSLNDLPYHVWLAIRFTIKGETICS